MKKQILNVAVQLHNGASGLINLTFNIALFGGAFYLLCIALDSFFTYLKSLSA